MALTLLTSVVVKYGIAYDGCHDTGKALFAAPTTPSGPGTCVSAGQTGSGLRDWFSPFPSRGPTASVMISDTTRFQRGDERDDCGKSP